MSSLCNILFLLLLLQIQTEDEKLVFVMTHFRHGARAPQRYYSINDYQDYVKETWKNPGELTGMGQRQHYLLGLRNRLRYIEDRKFLSESFNPHEILIYSSPFNRTLVSVSSQLQGLYPQSAEKGEKLSEEQEKLSVPQVNINDARIQEAIKKLSLWALPNSMMIAPVRMINTNERKIILYDIEGCTDERDAIKKKNSETVDTLINIVKEFNNKYKDKLNKFYGKEQSNYDIHFLDNFCDAFIAGYIDRRKMSQLKEAGVNFDETIDFCFEFEKLNFRDWISGDKEHALAHLESGKLMSEFIHYMKRRVDADINNESLDTKYEDYSRPKMMMISGHDSTVSCYQIVLMEAFGKGLDFYRFPKFATQIAFEVTTKNDNKIGKSYKDYTVHYYFNDESVMNVTMDTFIETLTPHLWNDTKINEFCGFNTTTTITKTVIQEVNSSKGALVVFIILTCLLLLSTLFFVYKFISIKRSTESSKFDSLVPQEI